MFFCFSFFGSQAGGDLGGDLPAIALFAVAGGRTSISRDASRETAGPSIAVGKGAHKTTKQMHAEDMSGQMCGSFCVPFCLFADVLSVVFACRFVFLTFSAHLLFEVYRHSPVEDIDL